MVRYLNIFMEQFCSLAQASFHHILFFYEKKHNNSFWAKLHLVLYSLVIDWLPNLNFDLVEKNKKTPQQNKKTNESELMEVDNLIKEQKRSLFVDLPKEIELKISDLTIDQQVT